MHCDVNYPKISTLVKIERCGGNGLLWFQVQKSSTQKKLNNGCMYNKLYVW